MKSISKIIISISNEDICKFDNNQILILISDTHKKNWCRETFVSRTNNINEDWFIDCYWFLSTDFTWSNIHMNIEMKTIDTAPPPPTPKYLD